MTGKEHDRSSERRGKHGQRYFFAAIFSRDHGRLAHLKMAIDIFEYDDGVIDEPGERERKPAEHHAV